MTQPKQYDMAIIGAGSGNTVITDDFDDWSIALIEDGPIGGTCLNRGCIPSKMLIYTAERALAARNNERFGLDTTFGGADWNAIQARIFGRLDEDAASGLEYRTKQDHVDVFTERARFVDHKTIAVAGELIRAETIVLAAGAHPEIPEFPGIEDVDFHTSATVMRLEELPEQLIVIGGGFVSVEMSHIFESLGSRVTIIERGPLLLSREDETIAERVTRAYRDRMDVRLNTAVESVGNSGRHVRVVTDGGTVTGDTLLIATGRTPNGRVLQVGESGVAIDDEGFVEVDAHGRTNVPGIWALGDISSPAQLKHKANADARVVAHNIANPDDLMEIELGPIPHAVFGSPQVASVGPTEAELRAAGTDYVAVVRDYADAAYGWAMEDSSSVVKLIADTDTRLLLGVHIVGAHAATLIQQLIQGMQFGLTVDELARGQWYIHPALPEVVEQALIEVIERLRP